MIGSTASESRLAEVYTPRWIGAALLLALFCSAIYFLTAPGRLDIIDGAIRYEVTDSLLETGTPAIRNPDIAGVAGRNGLRYSYYPLGTAVTALPFVYAGGRLGRGALESKQFAFSLTTVPFAGALVAVIFLIFGRLGLPLPESLFWALVVAFCTPLWPYAGSTFDTAIQAFWLTVAIWAAVEAFAADSRGWAVASGAAFAMLINVQETYVVLVACIAEVSPVTIGALRARLAIRPVRIIGAGAMLGLGAVLAYNAYKFGHPLNTGRTTVAHPLVGNPLVGLAGLFLSPAKSVLLYSPTYAFALLGVRRLMQRDRQRFTVIGGCLMIHIALIASLKFWAGEWAWGPRYLIASLPLACIGLPFAARTGTPRRLLLTACGLGLVVQLLGISVDHQRYYFERSLVPFFWVVESSMYRDSPLFARPAELLAVMREADLPRVRALVPGPRPRSMTSTTYGPDHANILRVPAWMREHLVFVVPRPWPLWSRYLTAEERPGPTERLAAAGCAAALVSAVLLTLIAYQPDRRRSAEGTLEYEQVIES